MKSLLVFLALMVSSYAGLLPAKIKECETSDQSNCLLSRANKALSVFSNGYESLGIPPLDPLNMPDFSVDPKPGPVNIEQKYSNIFVKNISTGKFELFEINTVDCNFQFILVFEFNVLADFELKGKISAVPIDIKGQAVSDYPEFTVNCNATCEKYKENGKEYIRMLRAKTKLIIKKTKMVQFGIKDVENPELNRQAQHLQNFLKQNPNALANLLLPTVEPIWGRVILKLSNSVFTQIPIDELV